MDISETKDSLVAKIEAPGMEQKDIQISLPEYLLTVKGEKRQEKGLASGKADLPRRRNTGHRKSTIANREIHSPETHNDILSQ